MQPLMNIRDYDSNNYSVGSEPGVRLVMPQDYDNPIIEEEVPECHTDINESSNLRCPFCYAVHVFNPLSLGKVINFSCPDCRGSVPSITIMKQAGDENEYISSIELVSEDENNLINDARESLKVIKKIDN